MEGMILATDPKIQCQWVTGNGQCRFTIDANSERFCPMHKSGQVVSENKEAKRNYRLSKFQARVEAFADNAQIKSLREEIGITRMMIEEVLNSCNSSTDLILASGRISDLVMKCEKLVSSCHRLEASTGMLLDKASIFQLANVLVEIISEHVQDQSQLNVISDRIIKAISTSQPLALSDKAATPKE